MMRQPGMYKLASPGEEADEDENGTWSDNDGV